MSLSERLLSVPTLDSGEDPHPRPQPVPPGWSVGYEWDGERGVIRTAGLMERPRTWDEFIRDAGLDPAEVTVLEPVSVRGWDANMGDGHIGRLRYYALRLVRRSASMNIDELVKIVSKRRSLAERPAGDEVFVIATGDLQLGKRDGDGTEGTIGRYLDGIAHAAVRLRCLRRMGHKLGHIHLAYLGDCVEGFVSQGGANAWRTTLTLTEQIRILRRLMLQAIFTLAPLADRMTVVSVPGNHDEAVRFGASTTRYDDSFAIEGLVQVGDALAANPGAYGHVQLTVPGRDELVKTVDLNGTVIAHAHGHKWRPGKHFDWWSGQTFGEQSAGAASILLGAHQHHLVVDTRGRRTYIQVPALESESTWWRHKTGDIGNPGIVTFLAHDGSWSNLAVV